MIPLRYSNSKVVSNKALEVLQASCVPFDGNRFVYICLKEAQSHGIEIPKQEQMNNRIQSNRAIERLYDDASALCRCLKKANESKYHD